MVLLSFAIFKVELVVDCLNVLFRVLGWHVRRVLKIGRQMCSFCLFRIRWPGRCIDYLDSVCGVL